ncbi:MAG: hypothetical protein GXY77_20485 [Fibrobacter sp.]|nr:hypothetical protein [Fibrobacter sp.]
MTYLFKTASVVLVTFLLFTNCKLVSDDGNDSQGLNSLKLKSEEASGWVESALFDFNVSNCTKDAGLNGGAQKYIEKGLVEGFKQTFSKSSFNFILIVIDFGNSSNANAMFSKMHTEEVFDEIIIDGFSENEAIIDNSPLSGVDAYAHFGKYYFELHFTGYSKKADAKNAASSFLELFRNKVSNLK